MPSPPHSSRHGQAEHAEPAIFSTTGSGISSSRRCHSWRAAHLAVDEAAELAADLFQRLVAQLQRTEVAGLEAVGDQLGDAHAHRRGVGRDQLAHGRRVERRAVDAEIARPHDLDLADGDAAAELREIFAERRLQHQQFELAPARGRPAQRRIWRSAAT